MNLDDFRQQFEQEYKWLNPLPKREDFVRRRPGAARIVGQVLHGSRVGVVIVAVAMLVASAIRNVTAVYDNYTASGSSGIVAGLAAATFVVGVEGAIFFLALAQEQTRMRQREDGTRRVANLGDLLHGLNVRLGKAEPHPWEALPKRDGLGMVIALAFGFAVIANVGVAMRGEFEVSGLPLHEFLASLPARAANEQVRFFENLAIALLPPTIALIAGHITARWASEYAVDGSEDTAEAAYQDALAEWRSGLERRWRQEVRRAQKGQPANVQAFIQPNETLNAPNDAGVPHSIPHSIPRNGTRNEVEQSDLDTRRARVLEHYRNNPGPTFSDASDALDISVSTLSRDLAHLVKRGLLRKDEEGKYWPANGVAASNGKHSSA